MKEKKKKMRQLPLAHLNTDLNLKQPTKLQLCPVGVSGGGSAGSGRRGGV